MSMDGKMIRFIDSQYNELFTIPDGGSIVVSRSNGEQTVGVCKYLDETHFEANGICYHICQFAEIQERNDFKYEPENEPEMVDSYRITNRIPVGNKTFVLGHSPKAVEPYATWQAYRDKPGKDLGHYWTNRSDAWTDLQRRANAERTGIPYDHTKKYIERNREDAR